mgnify:CR=1 FL=1
MTDIKLDDDVPMPTRGRKFKYPWTKMKIGQSFFVPGANMNGSTEERPGPRMGNMAYQASKLYGRKFSCESRVEEGVAGVRVWRKE